MKFLFEPKRGCSEERGDARSQASAFHLPNHHKADNRRKASPGRLFSSHSRPKRRLVESGFCPLNTIRGQKMNQIPRSERKEWKELLKAVSRTFSLSLFALPRKQRDFVALTYLVARVADCLADSGNWSGGERARYLNSWLLSLKSKSGLEWQFEDSLGALSPAEAELLLNSKKIISLYQSAPQKLKHFGDELLETLIEGMLKLVEQSSHVTESKPVWCHATRAELDQYCFYHAGCVGLFWNRVFDLPKGIEPLAVEYGKALERLNILRDVVEDRREGRILLDQESLGEFRFHTDQPWLEPQWAEYTRQYFEETRPSIERAFHYVDSLPSSERRLRFASMLPIRILLASFSLYLKESEKKELTKISRAEVMQIVRESLWESLWCRKISASQIKNLKQLAE